MLLLLLLPLLLGGGLRKVLGLAELLGGLCHGAAGTVATAAPVTVAPALLPFALPLVVPVSSSCVPLSPEPRHLLPRLWWPPRHVCVCGKQQECLCPDMCVCDVDATAATRQPPAATKKDATASGADAAACAAAATHPVSLHCTELPPLPLPYLLSSLSLSLRLHRPVTQSCVQHGGDPAAELSLFLSVKCPPLHAALPLSPIFVRNAFLSQWLLFCLA